MLKIIITFYRMGAEALKKGATLIKIRRLKIVNEITRMKLSISNDEVEKLDELQSRLEREMTRLGDIYANF